MKNRACDVSYNRVRIKVINFDRFVSIDLSQTVNFLYITKGFSTNSTLCLSVDVYGP